MNGLVLTFRLAGINNQNFLMRDDETGTYWQQISGRAISGPLAGQSLQLIPSDELTFGLWRSEQPGGKVLKEIPRDVSGYAPKNWEAKLPRAYAPVLFFPEHGLEPRDVMLTTQAFGEARAWRYQQIREEKLVNDRLGSESVLLLLGPDNESVRAFRTDGLNEFFRTAERGASMIDSDTGSRWNFSGCAIEGRLQGTCLRQISIMKDFWFDWRNYHPETTVYDGPGRKKR